jgi:transposase-like protein
MCCRKISKKPAKNAGYKAEVSDLCGKCLEPLNNIVEQDHRHIKRITNPMLSFKSFASAKATIAGVELHHMLKKGQMIGASSTPVWQKFYELAA